VAAAGRRLRNTTGSRRTYLARGRPARKILIRHGLCAEASCSRRAPGRTLPALWPQPPSARARTPIS